MATREQAMTALLALLAATAQFVTIGRRNRDPESLSPAESPALFLVEHSENYDRKSRSLPAIRRLHVKAIFYNDSGDNTDVIPSTPINNALDSLDLALKPDSPMTGAFTLGGLVTSLMIDGEIEKAPGDVTGKSLAVVPLVIELP